MSYACADILYGIRATKELTRAMESWTDTQSDYEDGWCWEDLGFEERYSGNGESTPTLGVELASMDECDDVRVSTLTLEPTPEQVEQVRKMIADLPEPLQAAAEEPDVWIIWSSS